MQRNCASNSSTIGWMQVMISERGQLRGIDEWRDLLRVVLIDARDQGHAGEREDEHYDDSLLHGITDFGDSDDLWDSTGREGACLEQNVNWPVAQPRADRCWCRVLHVHLPASRTSQRPAS
jgi:hypothetical protein